MARADNLQPVCCGSLFNIVFTFFYNAAGKKLAVRFQLLRNIRQQHNNNIGNNIGNNHISLAFRAVQKVAFFNCNNFAQAVSGNVFFGNAHGVGVNIYGKENPDGPTLYDAVKTVLDVPGVQRLRLGSLESVEVEPRLLTLMQEDARFCRHLHLPLQSGCDKTLQAMHRPYTTAKFKTLLADIKTRVPDIAITTDVIVGFPGETEADFETTCKFAESCGFSKMHIFPFSARKGTPAEKFAGAVTETVKKERADILGRIDETMHKTFLQAMVGQNAKVLFEQPAGEDYFEGLTGNYQRVFVKCGGRNLGGEILPVKITAFDGEKLLGEIIKD